MPTKYTNPGCHAMATYEEALEYAKSLMQDDLWIMEVPESERESNPYAVGWSVIRGTTYMEHFSRKGYIPRAQVILKHVVIDMWTARE